MESCDFATCRIKFKVTFAVESVSQLQILEIHFWLSRDALQFSTCVLSQV